MKAFYITAVRGHHGAEDRIGGQPTCVPVHVPWSEDDDRYYGFLPCGPDSRVTTRHSFLRLSTRTRVREIMMRRCGGRTQVWRGSERYRRGYAQNPEGVWASGCTAGTQANRRDPHENSLNGRHTMSTAFDDIRKGMEEAVEFAERNTKGNRAVPMCTTRVTVSTTPHGWSWGGTNV